MHQSVSESDHAVPVLAVGLLDYFVLREKENASLHPLHNFEVTNCCHSFIFYYVRDLLITVLPLKHFLFLMMHS